jgi:hypothetical protein
MSCLSRYWSKASVIEEKAASLHVRTGLIALIALIAHIFRTTESPIAGSAPFPDLFRIVRLVRPFLHWGQHRERTVVAGWSDEPSRPSPDPTLDLSDPQTNSSPHPPMSASVADTKVPFSIDKNPYARHR